MTEGYDRAWGKKWHLVFSVTLWHLWLWRNARVFKLGQQSLTPKQTILSFVRDIVQAHEQAQVTAPRVQREDTVVGWTKPDGYTLKINTDGARQGDTSLAGEAGLIRDGNGKCSLI